MVCDVFAGARTPAHLTSAEFAADVHRVLRPDGVYAANVADGPPLRFARAQVATLRSVFRHVCLLAEPGTLRGRRFGNLVAVASDAELPIEGSSAAARATRCPPASSTARTSTASPAPPGRSTTPTPSPHPSRPRASSAAERRLEDASSARLVEQHEPDLLARVRTSTARTPATACRAASSTGQP